MFFISHRGNIDTVNEDEENRLDYIDNAIELGYDVEIDLREHNGKYYLGHDAPDHPVTLSWLLQRKAQLWIHTKDINALVYCRDKPLNFFFHEKERHTLISNGLIWTHDLTECTSLSVIPLISEKLPKNETEEYAHVAGICSDYISHYREILL